MKLSIDESTLALTRSVVGAAVNLPFAQAVERKHGPRAAIKRMYGRRVSQIPGAKGIVLERPISLAVRRGGDGRRRRSSGRSGKSNWPGGSKEERRAEMERRAAARDERLRRKQLADLAAAAAAMAKTVDGGEGPFRLASMAHLHAMLKVREEVAAKMQIPAESLMPSAAAAVTLTSPASVASHMDGVLVVINDSLRGLEAGTARRVRKTRDKLHFQTPGSHVALMFRTGPTVE